MRHRTSRRPLLLLFALHFQHAWLVSAWEFIAQDLLPQHIVPIEEVPVSCDTTMDDLHSLFRDNLYEDMRYWRSFELNMSAFDRAVKRWPDTDVTRLALIYNNTFYFPQQPQPDPLVHCENCNRYIWDAIRGFAHWNQTIHFPNTLFMINVHDHPKNGPSPQDPGPVPILSLAKMDPALTSKSFIAYRDILIPKIPTKDKVSAYVFPWDKKENKAIWRGTRWGDFGTPQKHVNMSRWYVAELIKQNEEAREYIDFGYTAADEGVPKVPSIHHPDLMRWKFLLNLDGFTAAYRLAKYLLTNSVVLKEESTKIEYYYRSLKPYKHYIPVFRDNKTDILDIIRHYRRPDTQDELIHIASEARAFSAKYLCPRARMLYWQRALLEYRSLFPDMDSVIESKWWPMVKAKLDRAHAAQTPIA